jgi:O-antigen ligase
MNKSKLFPILLFAYVLSLAFQDFMRFSTVFRKVQLPEIIFLLLILSFPFTYFRQYRFDKSDRFLIGTLSVYWFTNIISSVMSGQFSAIAESFGRLYLILLFGMATFYFAQLSRIDLKRYAQNACLALGILLSLTGIGGIIARICGFQSFLVGISENYPYLGTVYRAQGFTHTPAMLVSLLIFTGIIVYTEGSFFELKIKNSKFKMVEKTTYETLKTTENTVYTEGSSHFSKWRILGLVLMIIAAILTFSRSATFLFWGLALVFVFKKWGFSKKILSVSAFVLTLFMTVGTHFIIISKNSSDLPALYASDFTSNRILMEQGNYVALETSYLAIKRASINIWETQPIVGIGTGNFVNSLRKMQETGIYPQKLPIYEAHSTYLGTLVENGIFGATAIIAFLSLLWLRIYGFENLYLDAFAVALLLSLTTVLIESIALDTLNFRHYWLLFALIWAYPKKGN